LTIVTYGPQFHVCIEAVSEIEAELNVSIEVIDLMTLFPFDLNTIAESVTKTGRLLITHEGPKHNSLSSEIAS
jgi:2-oxoisovalerate dehydrogenase E1 component beta subunit